jgi:hypothetical protein
MHSYKIKYLSAVYFDERPRETVSLRIMAMLLLLVCAVGVVSFMIFALAYYASLQGRNLVSQEYMKDIEAKRAVITAENRRLLAALGSNPLQRQADVPDGSDSTNMLNRSADDFRRLAEEYTKTLKELVALRVRAQTKGPGSENRFGEPGYFELERLQLEKRTLLSELRDLERDARFGSSGEVRALHAEIREDGCVTYPEGEIMSCNGFSSALIDNAYRNHIDLVVLWIRPGAGEPYFVIEKALRDAGLRVSHEPLPIGESVEGILAGLRND